MREEEVFQLEKDRFSVVTDILSDVEEEEAGEVGRRQRRRGKEEWALGEQHPLSLGQRRRYRILRPKNIRGPSVAGERGNGGGSTPYLIRFCVSHSKTCDRDLSSATTECQAAMSSTAAVVTTAAAAARTRTEESVGAAAAAVAAAVREEREEEKKMSGGGGGDIVTVTTVSKAIRPWDIATVVSSSEKRWVLS